jgi:YHS domain-containing protein
MRKVTIIVGILLGVLLISNRLITMGSLSECAHDSEIHKHEEKSENKSKLEKTGDATSFQRTIYVCPLHTEVQQEKEGKCPKCNTQLEEKQLGMTYTCPEKDCEYKKGTPGKCPRHDKELIKCELKSPQSTTSTQNVEPVFRRAIKDEIGKKVICPVMGSKFIVKSDTEVADYKGKSYYFCCPACPSEFKKDPEKYAK